jgi:hypothetical protein
MMEEEGDEAGRVLPVRLQLPRLPRWKHPNPLTEEIRFYITFENCGPRCGFRVCKSLGQC